LQLRIDLHVHSYYSRDSVITPEQLIFYAKKHGLHAIAITDHERIDGAMKIAKEKHFLVIPGIEVSSLNGHIVGLNVREVIPAKLGVDETVDRIHDAGGLAVACHPMTFFKGSLGKRTNLKFDAVEVINASAFPFHYSVRRGKKLASQLGKAETAGSDAHYGPEIGCAYTLVEAELEFDDVIRALTKGSCRAFGRAIPFDIRLKREVFVLKKKIALSKIL
jgi:hypothetical protein